MVSVFLDQGQGHHLSWLLFIVSLVPAEGHIQQQESEGMISALCFVPLVRTAE